MSTLSLSRSYGTLENREQFYFYPYLVPNGTVPSGQNVGRMEIVQIAESPGGTK